jgi:hypothetical protein
MTERASKTQILLAWLAGLLVVGQGCGVSRHRGANTRERDPPADTPWFWHAAE